MTSPLAQLPVDQATFRRLRDKDFLYVDKTQYAHSMITSGRCFFLSRPRRFGKSLLVSTLQEILLGNRDVFKGLWIENSGYAWHPHGAITLNLSSMSTETDTELKEGISMLLGKAAKEHAMDITLSGTKPELDLHEVVSALYKRFGRVALLIDEYDSPILRSLHDKDRAQRMRTVLHSFFSTILLCHHV